MVRACILGRGIKYKCKNTISDFFFGYMPHHNRKEKPYKTETWNRFCGLPQKRNLIK